MPVRLSMSSGVHQGRPWCRMSLATGDEQYETILSPDQVRNMALAFISAAEAAENDASVTAVMEDLFGEAHVQATERVLEAIAMKRNFDAHSHARELQS